MEIHEIIHKLLGNIEPYGDSNIDKKRLDNLYNYIDLINDLIRDLINVTKYKNRPEDSMKKMGIVAYNTLEELKEIIDNEI